MKRKSSLRIVLGVVLTLMAESALGGEEYGLGIAGIRIREKRIEQKLSRLGLPSANSENRESGSKVDGSGASHLFNVHGDLTRRQIPVGRLIFGRTHVRLIVGGEESPVIVELDSDQGTLSGLRLLGKARPSSTEGRVLLEFDRILFPAGKATPIRAQALDEAGALGISAESFSSKALSIAGSMASSFVSGLAASQITETQTPFGFSRTEPSSRNGILHGIAQSSADQSKRLIEDSTREKPILVIEPGTPVTVLVNEEVRW